MRDFTLDPRTPSDMMTGVGNEGYRQPYTSLYLEFTCYSHV